MKLFKQSYLNIYSKPAPTFFSVFCACLHGLVALIALFGIFLQWGVIQSQSLLVFFSLSVIFIGCC